MIEIALFKLFRLKLKYSIICRTDLFDCLLIISSDDCSTVSMEKKNVLVEIETELIMLGLGNKLLWKINPTESFETEFSYLQCMLGLISVKF